MTSVRNGASVALGAVLLIVGVAGCAGPGEAVDPSDGAGGPNSPLAKYYSLVYSPLEQGDIDRQNAEVQSRIASCMKEQGFEYQPDSQNASFMVADDSGLDWSSEEFATTYGYGITTDPLGVNDRTDDGGQQHSDPNAEYTGSLSESELAAYNDALWGPTPEETPAGEAAEYDWAKGGCNGKAQHEVGMGSGAESDPEFADLIEQMNSLYGEVRSAPSVTAKERAWADCMADAGYAGFVHKDDAPAAISDAYSALMSPPDENGATSTSAPDADPDEVKSLQQREIAQATADFGCARDSGYAQTLAAEQHRIEQAFVDEHREQLDALVARYGGSQQ